MKQGIVEKMIERWESLSSHELQSLLLKLVEQRGVFKQVFEAMKEGIILFDNNGKVTFANQAACGIFGLDCKDMMGDGFSKSVFGLGLGDVSRRIVPVAQEVEITYPEHKYLYFYFLPLRGEDGELEEEISPAGYALIVRDITHEQERTEEQIETEKMNALTLLAAGVAHEIGNPLNSLGLHLQLLDRKLQRIPGSEAQSCKSYLEVAQSELKRLDVILKQFLSAIRPQRLQREMSSLNEVIEQTAELLRLEVEDRNIEVVFDLEPNLPKLMLDTGQFKQVFYNLIKNAYQAIPAGGGRITISSYMTDMDICASVTDTGTGMSPEMMGTLFEPFRTSKESGTGLGLLIARRIVRDHGGSLRVMSEEGEGTNITIQIPRSERQVRLLPGAMEGEHHK